MGMSTKCRVEAGAAYLDALRGKDWVQLIDLRSLDLAKGEHCVLGQIYGNYGDGKIEILPPAMNQHSDETVRLMQSMGFAQTRGRKYSTLTLAWKKFLRVMKNRRRSR